MKPFIMFSLFEFHVLGRDLIRIELLQFGFDRALFGLYWDRGNQALLSLFWFTWHWNLHE